MPNPDSLIPTAQAAEILGCSVRTVVRLVDAGRLDAAVKMPGLRGGYMFERAEVEALRDPWREGADEPHAVAGRLRTPERRPA